MQALWETSFLIVQPYCISANNLLHLEHLHLMGTNFRCQREPMLGELVRDLRIRRKLSQVEIAEQGHFSTAWLSRVEANTIATPSPNKLRVLARILNVDPNELLIAAGYIRRDGNSRSPEEMSHEELMSNVQRFLNEVSRRMGQSPSEPIRLDDRRGGTDPSVRRQLRGTVAGVRS